MAEQQNRQDQDKVIIRLPDGMRDAIQAEAKANKRSANAEIVARLSQSGIGGGETLRDRFALASLTGLLACPDPDVEGLVARPGMLAADAYTLADAMLAERQKGGAA